MTRVMSGNQGMAVTLICKLRLVKMLWIGVLVFQLSTTNNLHSSGTPFRT